MKTKSRWNDDYVYEHYSFSPVFDEFDAEKFESNEPNILLNVLSDKAMFIVLESLDLLDYPTMKIAKDQTALIVTSHLDFFENLFSTIDRAK